MNDRRVPCAFLASHSAQVFLNTTHAQKYDLHGILKALDSHETQPEVDPASDVDPQTPRDCLTDAEYRKLGMKEMGCEHGAFISDACKAAGGVRSGRCATVVGMIPQYDQGYVQASLNNRGVKFVMPFIGYGGALEYVQWSVQSSNGAVVFYFWEVRQRTQVHVLSPPPFRSPTHTHSRAHPTQDPMRDVGAQPDVFITLNKGVYSRIALPHPTSECWDQSDGTPFSGVDCDFPPQTIAKLSAHFLVDDPEMARAERGREGGGGGAKEVCKCTADSSLLKIARASGRPAGRVAPMAVGVAGSQRICCRAVRCSGLRCCRASQRSSCSC